MTRWMLVCDSAVQPAVDDGSSMQCSQSDGTVAVMSVDTVVNEASAPFFDAAAAGAFFGFAFASTMFLWLLSLGAGMIIRMIKTAKI